MVSAVLPKVSKVSQVLLLTSFLVSKWKNKINLSMKIPHIKKQSTSNHYSQIKILHIITIVKNVSEIRGNLHLLIEPKHDILW